MSCHNCAYCKAKRKIQNIRKSKDSLEALQFMNGLTMPSNNPPGWNFLKAKLHMECGLWSEALALLEGLLKIMEPSHPLMLAYADCLVSVGNISEARLVLAAESKNPCQCFVLQVLQARVAASMGDEPQTWQFLSAAMNLNRRGATALAMGYPELAPLAPGAFHEEGLRAMAG